MANRYGRGAPRPYRDESMIEVGMRCARPQLAVWWSVIHLEGGASLSSGHTRQGADVTDAAQRVPTGIWMWTRRSASLPG